MNTKHPYSVHSRQGAGNGSEDPRGNARQGDAAYSNRDHAAGEHSPHAKERAREAYAAAHEAHGADSGAGDPNNAAGMFDGMPSYSPSNFSPLGGLFADDGSESSGNGVPDTSPPLSDEQLVALCRQRVCPECSVKKEAEEIKLRSLADLDNARKRLAREKDEQVRFAAEAVLSDILPSLDNLDLALQHAGSHEACKNFVVGVQMTRKLMLDALQKHGLVQVGAMGEEFDPSRHEAVGMQDVPEVPEGYVCGLLSYGYTLKDRLLRPARVMVCKRS